MKIEIWSDVMCPFCYIGKRKFEQALAAFPHKDLVEIEWKSFQLNPYVEYNPDKDIYDTLAEMKGQSREWAISMHQYVKDMAAKVGLNFDFDQAKIANTWDAHRILQLAKKNNLGDAMEERLFRAYFTEGAIISDHSTLIQLATEVGINPEEVKNVLIGNDFTQQVQEDLETARRFGINGVPFFGFNRKYGISGAQDSEYFLEMLHRVYTEMPQQIIDTPNGVACSVEEGCQ